jgi:hypothetical protein
MRVHGSDLLRRRKHLGAFDPRALRVCQSAEKRRDMNVLAYLAEVDSRRLCLPAAYPSMYAYCVGELRLSEEAAHERIRAARAARQYPAIFDAVADGHLYLSGVVMLAAYLTPENAEELLTAAAHRSKTELEQLLAQRFPRPEVPARVQVLSPSPRLLNEQLSPGTVEPPAPRAKVAPLAPQRLRSSSRSSRRRTTCCATRRRSSAARSRREISQGSSIGLSKRSSASSRSVSLRRPPGRAPGGGAGPGARANSNR